jgi:hypothetical protein
MKGRKSVNSARVLRALLGTTLLVRMVGARRPAVAQRDAAAGYPNKIIRIVAGFAAESGRPEVEIHL